MSSKVGRLRPDWEIDVSVFPEFSPNEIPTLTASINNLTIY